MLEIEILNRIKSITEQITDEIVQIRRTLHQYPELSWQEKETAQRLSEWLKKENCRVNTSFLKTSVIAEFGTGADSHLVAMRADMDALPLQDVKTVEYASRVPGVIHACGHDAHMAIAIGVVKVLNRLNLTLPGKIRFIFQPSEEADPSGAKELVEAGVTENVKAIFAFHVDPEIPAGKIGLRDGVLTAHCNEFQLSIFGKSGHAARPHHSVDTIFLANQVLNSYYQIIGSHSTPGCPAVLTIGKIAGGSKANVIPDRVDILGTLRTIDIKVREEIISIMKKRVEAITQSAGGGFKLEFKTPILSVINDEKLINLARKTVEALFSEKQIFEIPQVSMGGEDFAWYLTKTPGILMRLGARMDVNDVRYLHTNNFDINEKAIPFGISIMTALILNYFLTHDENSG